MSAEWFAVYEAPNAVADVAFYVEMPSNFKAVKALQLRQYKVKGHSNPDDQYCILHIPQLQGEVRSNQSVAKFKTAVLDIQSADSSQVYSPSRPLLSVATPLENVNRLKIELYRPNGSAVQANAVYMWFDLIF